MRTVTSGHRSLQRPSPLLLLFHLPFLSSSFFFAQWALPVFLILLYTPARQAALSPYTSPLVTGSTSRSIMLPTLRPGHTAFLVLFHYLLLLSPSVNALPLSRRQTVTGKSTSVTTVHSTNTCVQQSSVAKILWHDQLLLLQNRWSHNRNMCNCIHAHQGQRWKRRSSGG